MKAVISHISDDPAEILDIIEKSRYYPQMKQKAEESELPFPFHREMLKLLKQSNPLQQKYYYLEDEKHYAFFCSYMNRMDLFTFGKAQLFIKLQTIFRATEQITENTVLGISVHLRVEGFHHNGFRRFNFF